MSTRQAFIAQQAASLQPLDFVVVTVMHDPPAAIELAHEEGGEFRVTAASPRQPFTAGRAEALAGLGFTATKETWSSGALPDATSATALVERVLTDALGADDTVAIDVSHGSRRPIVEAQRRLDAMRARVAPILASMLGTAAPVDEDGDFVVKLGSAEIFVSPLALPDMLPVIRVFAITNAGVNLTPELGLFLSRVNFTLLFGRFALDTDHRAVWFSETLLGEAFSDEELRFTVLMVAETAGEWDDRIAEMFGGVTSGAPQQPEQPMPAKPGQPPSPERSGYL